LKCSDGRDRRPTGLVRAGRPDAPKPPRRPPQWPASECCASVLGKTPAGLWLQVDASRRRNDPHNATRGCRAWCGLGVSPAHRRAGCRPGVETATSGLLVVLGVKPPPPVHRPPQQASVGAKTRSAAGASPCRDVKGAPGVPAERPYWGSDPGGLDNFGSAAARAGKLQRTIDFWLMSRQRAGGPAPGGPSNTVPGGPSNTAPRGPTGRRR
jgi:hypothetical protein